MPKIPAVSSLPLVGVALLALSALQLGGCALVQPPPGQAPTGAINPATEPAQPRPAQELDGLYADLKKSLGPDAFFASGESVEEAFDAMGGGSSLAVEGQPFDQARSMSVTKVPEQIWMANMEAWNTQPLYKGEMVLLSYYAKGTAKSGSAELQTVLKYQDDSTPVVQDHKVTLTPEWKRYNVLSNNPVPRDAAARKAQLLFMVGMKEQEVFVGGVAIVAFKPGADMSRVPQSSN